MIGVGSQVGSYKVHKLLGKGGMGQVFIAEHVRLGRPVALKILHPHVGSDPQIVARFFNEARAVNRIRHEHIVEVTDDGTTAEQEAYYVMELLEGESLGDRLKQLGRFPAAQAVDIVLQIADALAATHAAGIVHRDLKPDNVFLIRRSGNPDYVKLLDFGIAKLLEDSPVKTQTGAVLGTAYYMSPEQCRGADVDHRTDLYALGIVLYQMLVGAVPFHAGSTAGILIKHLTEPCPAPGLQVPGLSPRLEALLLRLVAKNAADRWQSATELHDQLLALRPHLGPTAVNPAGPSAAHRVVPPTGRAAQSEVLGPTLLPPTASPPLAAAAPDTPTPPAAVAALATPSPPVASPAPGAPADPTKAPISTLALLAFILSCLFVVPVLGLLGAVLGIIAAIRWKDHERGRWMALAAIPIGVLGVLVWVGIPSYRTYNRYLQKSKSSGARTQAQQVRLAVETHRVGSGGSCPDSLEVLVKKGLLSKVPVDPWGERFQLSMTTGGCNVISTGPDRLLGTEDDIELPVRGGP